MFDWIVESDPDNLQQALGHLKWKREEDMDGNR